MSRYFYQTKISEYESGMNIYLDRKNKPINLYFYKYYEKIVEFYEELQHYYNMYSLAVKKIVEQDGINLENIDEVLKLEMYLYNIVSIYQDDTIFEECIFKESSEFEKNLEKWIHCIDKNTILAYFDRKYDLDTLNDKKMFFNFFSKKPELHSLRKANF